MDKTAILWDIEANKPIMTFVGHQKYLMTVALSPDAKYVLTGSQDKTAILWDASTGKAIHTLIGHQHPIVSVAFSPDGKTALTGSGDGTAILWDVFTGRIKLTFLGHQGPVSSVSFSPDGKKVITGGKDGTIKIWDIAPSKPIKTLSIVNSSIFSSDGKLILSSKPPGILETFNIETNEAIKLIESNTIYTQGIKGLSPDGKKLLAGNSLYDVKSGKQIHSFYSVKFIAFSPDGKNIVIGNKYKSQVELWNIEPVQLMRTFSNIEANKASFFSDSKSIAFASFGIGIGKVVILNISTGEIVKTITLNDSRSVAFSPDGKKIVTGEDGVIKLWDIISGKLLCSFEARRPQHIISLAFSPDGLTILSGYDKIVDLWDISTQKLIQTFNCDGTVHSVSFSPNAMFISASILGVGGAKTEIWHTYHSLLKNNNIYNFSKKEMRDKGLQLELEDLLTLWEQGEKLNVKELQLINKDKNKNE